MRYIISLFLLITSSYSYLLQDPRDGQLYECSIYNGDSCSPGFTGFVQPYFYIHSGGDKPGCTYGSADQYYACNPVDCPAGQIYNPDTQTCIDDCKNTPPPDSYRGYPFIASYPEEQDCLDAISQYNIQNGFCISNDLLPTYQSDDCPGYYLFGDMSDPCNDVLPPATYGGYPYAGKYPSLDICVDAVRYFGGGSGECMSSEPCSYYFGYFNRPDNNYTNPGNFNNSNDLPDGPTPPGGSSGDNNNSNLPDTGSPDNTDDNNDSIDLNPLLDQIKQASDRNHNDIDRLGDRLDFSLSDLTDMISDLRDSVNGLGGNIDDVKNAIDSKDLNFSFDTSGIEQRLDALNTNQGPTLPDDTSIDDFIANFQTQFSSIQTSLENVRNILTGGVPNISLPLGSDPSVSGTVIGKQVTFSSCETLQSVRPAFTLIFLIAFTYLAIKIFWASIKLILRG